MKTVEAARGRWPGIFMHFGVDARYLNPKKHSDCPLCGQGKDCYRFADRDGNGNFFCNRCHPSGGSAFTFLMEWTGKEFKDVAKEIDEIVGNITIQPQPKQKDPRIRLQATQRGVVPMDGVNPVRIYLKSRGLVPTPAIEYHPGLAYYEDGKFMGKKPAMLCRVLSPSGVPMTYHVTYLTEQGKKIGGVARKMLPPAGDLTGAAIRLFPAQRHIAVAEGVETALAVEALYGLPCWATANANQLEKFTPPEGVESVSIFGDNDSSYTGQKAAYVLANRLTRTHEVDVFIPDMAGIDFADELIARNQE